MRLLFNSNVKLFLSVSFTFTLLIMSIINKQKATIMPLILIRKRQKILNTINCLLSRIMLFQANKKKKTSGISGDINVD